MGRLSLPSRVVRLAAIAALAAWSAGVGAGWAQAPAAPSTVQPTVADPVSAAVAEASRRFGVPASWIWSVMRVESAGRTRAVSSAGAMGLMQVMPQTYAELRSRYGLGADPFDVRDNILAGAAYLREMHDRYGATGMLAAYNAGPGRWEAYVRAGRRLPAETVDYLTRLAPEMGAAAVPITSNVQAIDVTQVPRPTLFVQLADTTAAADAFSVRSVPVAAQAGRSASPPRQDNLFVRRLGSSDNAPQGLVSEPASVASVHSAPAPAAASNSLFAPVSSSPDRR